MHARVIVTVAAALGGQAAAAATPDDRAGIPLSYPDLEISFLGGAWLPRLDGTVTQGPGGTSFDLGSQFDLDSQEATPNFELGIRKDQIWEIVLTGYAFSTSTTGLFDGAGTFGSIVFAPGDPFAASFDITSVSGEILCTVWRPFAEGHSHDQGARNLTDGDRYIADLRISPQFGMRYFDVDQDVQSGASSVTTGGEWLNIYAGLSVALEYRPEHHVPLVDMLRLEGVASFGPALGGDGGIVYQIRAGVTLQITEHFGVQMGYRLVELDVENADYKLEGGLQGLYVAGSLRF